jgi:hypothetical protein
MTEVKIPTHPEIHSYAWTKLELAAIKQYGDDRAREALEMAASIANDEPQEQSGDGTYVCTPYTIARAIRALKEQIK